MTKVVEHFYDSEIGDTITVVFMDMDPQIKGQAVYVVSENSYTIYINARHNMETQKAAFYHELEHIHSKDFEKTDVQKIEMDAHGLTSEPTFDPEEYFKEERRQKTLDNIAYWLRKQRRAEARAKKKLDERNEILSHFGHEEAYEVRGDEYGCPRIVLTGRRRKKGL